MVASMVFWIRCVEKEKGKKMKRFEKGPTWLVALLLLAFLPGCGDSILGSSGSSSGSGGSGPGRAGVVPALGAAAAFGGFGGGSGMTNQGVFTVIRGAQGQPVSIGTTGASTTITGFHDTSVAYTPPAPTATGCSYTETTLNIGAVNGTINTDAPPPNVPFCPLEGTAGTMSTAQAAAAAALAAFNDLAGRPGATDPGANLGGLTLAPGIYKTTSGAFLITGSDLTLDAGGNANAVWVFQTASTLTVGAAGAPRSVILAGGAQPKNVFWHVGSSATI